PVHLHVPRPLHDDAGDDDRRVLIQPRDAQARAAPPRPPAPTSFRPMATLPDSPAVHALADLAAFQEGSIVSRMLLKNKAGSVTLFAFGEGEGLSEHTAPFDALIVVSDGTAEVTIDGERFDLGPGETIR